MYCRTTSASTAPRTPRRMCCLAHGASYCAPCQQLLPGAAPCPGCCGAWRRAAAHNKMSTTRCALCLTRSLHPRSPSLPARFTSPHTVDLVVHGRGRALHGGRAWFTYSLHLCIVAMCSLSFTVHSLSSLGEAYSLQGISPCKKPPPLRTLQWDYAQGLMVPLTGGAVFL